MEKIAKDRLEQLFLVEKKTRKEIAEIFGVKIYVIDNAIKDFNLRRQSQQEILDQVLSTFSKEQVQDLYKDHSHSEMCDLLGGITQDILNRVLKIYGLGKRSKLKNALKNFTKEELEKLYLQDNLPMQELAKRLNTNPLTLYRVLRKYGIVKPKSLVHKNAQKTWLEKYGTDNINKAPGVAEKRKQTCMERYGVECYLISQQCYSKFRNDSRPNRAFAKILDSHNIPYSREFPIGNRSYDFKIGNKLVEINPYPTHNSNWGIGRDKKGKDPRYHYEKSKLANENGYQCIHVFDWDDRDKIIQLLQPRKNLYARKLKLKEIPQLEANRFLKQYHLQGGSKMQNPCYGLYLNGELIEVMTFGKPRFNKNYEWELIRLCTKTGYCVVGGAERLFKAFIRDHNPNSIISYCDNAKFTGNVYTRLGFKHKSAGAVSRHWYNPETGVHITDNGLRFKGFDKLLGSTYGTFGKGTSNDDLMREHGFYEVYDAGQSVYVWTRE